jgi:hypothetical protein
MRIIKLKMAGDGNVFTSFSNKNTAILLLFPIISAVLIGHKLL